MEKEQLEKNWSLEKKASCRSYRVKSTVHDGRSKQEKKIETIDDHFFVGYMSYKK